LLPRLVSNKFRRPWSLHRWLVQYCNLPPPSCAPKAESDIHSLRNHVSVLIDDRLQCVDDKIIINDGQQQVHCTGDRRNTNTTWYHAHPPPVNALSDTHSIMQVAAVISVFVWSRVSRSPRGKLSDKFYALRPKCSMYTLALVAALHCSICTSTCSLVQLHGSFLFTRFFLALPVALFWFVLTATHLAVPACLPSFIVVSLGLLQIPM
jgi:hypothetical protein